LSRSHHHEIVVAGEVLVDLVPDDAGRLAALPGGAPFNVARIVALLGEDCTFLGRLSDDPLGARLRSELLSAGVRLAVPQPTSAPTTLAMAQLDEYGSAVYRFYWEGTSTVSLVPGDLPSGLLDGARVFALGALGVVYEPIRSTLLELVADAPPELLVLLDPNCRPLAIDDLEHHRDTIETLLARADIVKVSVEDVALLAPGTAPLDYATAVVGRGPSLVLITDGPRAATLVTAEGVRKLAVPAVAVVDTIGAGDGFVAGLLAWLADHEEIDPRTAELDVLAAGVEAAIEVSGAVCRARGAALPDGFSWSARAVA
jgi:fructokinase